jgi:dihydrofolate reductase
MSRVIVFNSVTVDGYFVDSRGDMSWAHQDDPEWTAFVAGNASGGGVLLFGRVTYELMAGFWPTPMASKAFPVVAERMNSAQKIVFSRTMDEAAWSNTRLVKSDLAAAVRRMKSEPGEDMVILGSGSIVAQLTDERLIDEYQIVVVPVVLGRGRTMFEGCGRDVRLKLANSRTFANGNVLLRYQPIA